MTVPSYDFTGRVMLLTGAAGGIGHEVARRFVSSGGAVALADHDVAAAEAVANSLDPSGEHTQIIEYDASSSESATAAVQQVLRCFGRLDYLVPCAGIYQDQAARTMTDEQWRRTLSINLDGVFYIARAAMDEIAEGGAIVTVSSISGHRGSPEHAHYAASKAGIIGLTRTLAGEVGPGLRVNGVSPGIIQTGMTQKLLSDRGEDFISRTPLRRAGLPEEVASVIIFLCSDGASFVNGEFIHVNGGLFMAG